MGFNPGMSAKCKSYLEPDHLDAPFVDTRPKKTLADARLWGKVEGGKFGLVVHFLDPDGNLTRRGELASFAKRTDAREAMQEIIAINPKYKPEIINK